LGDWLEPACAKACPTDSIQFGPLDELLDRAADRVVELHEAGVTQARLYGEDPGDGVGGDGAFFLLLDEPEVYGLPPDPVVTTRDLPTMWRRVGAACARAGTPRRGQIRRRGRRAGAACAAGPGDGIARAAAPSSRWCRPPSSPRTTASRSSTRPSGGRRTSPATCSWAAWPAGRR